MSKLIWEADDGDDTPPLAGRWLTEEGGETYPTNKQQAAYWHREAYKLEQLARSDAASLQEMIEINNTLGDAKALERLLEHEKSAHCASKDAIAAWRREGAALEAQVGELRRERDEARGQADEARKHNDDLGRHTIALQTTIFHLGVLVADLRAQHAPTVSTPNQDDTET